MTKLVDGGAIFFHSGRFVCFISWLPTFIIKSSIRFLSWYCFDWYWKSKQHTCWWKVEATWVWLKCHTNVISNHLQDVCCSGKENFMPEQSKKNRLMEWIEEHRWKSFKSSSNNKYLHTYSDEGKKKRRIFSWDSTQAWGLLDWNPNKCPTMEVLKHFLHKTCQ